MPDDAGDKTEAPTPRRRQEAREEGNVAKSTDLTAAAMLMAACLVLWLGGDRLLVHGRDVLVSMLGGSATPHPARAEGVVQILGIGGWAMVEALGPLLLAVMAIGIIVMAVQVGPVLSAKPITPSLNKLNPAKGFKNIFGLRAAVRLGMSLGKVIIVGAVAAWVIRDELPAVLQLAGLEVGPAFVASAQLTFALAIKLAAVLLVLALLDYAYQKWQQEQDLKMTKQEVREEHKRMDGDPSIKQRRQRVARQLAMQRLSGSVPTADVIVTNPTHFAVALKYTAGEMAAPKVVAKGADFMAMRVRQLAAQHSIPVVERPPLARALFAGCEVGQQVPPEHYAAVAEVLAYVYRLAA